MPRQLHLIVYPGDGRVRAHWSLFIPTVSNASTGKIIHAVGTPFTGYRLVFKRNYNLETEDRKYKVISLCEVNDEHFIDTPGDGKMTEDIDAQDRLEQEAKRVDCPGVSKDPLNPWGGDGCQAWLKKYFEWLVQRKLVDQAALDVLESVPVV